MAKRKKRTARTKYLQFLTPKDRATYQRMMRDANVAELLADDPAFYEWVQHGKPGPFAPLIHCRYCGSLQP
jgi:hypothetical protein